MILLFGKEILQVFRFCRLPVALRFCLLVVVTFPAILRERKFYPADRRMRGVIEYKILDRWVRIDLDQFRAGLVFGFLREFAGRDVYFRGFDTSRLRFDVVIDAGANNGFVSEVFSILGGDENKVISIEPLYNAEAYTKDLLRRKPNIRRVEKAVLDGSVESAAYLYDLIDSRDLQTTTMAEILSENSIDKIQFMKIDIEGGEYPLLQNNSAWITLVDNLVMEVHQGLGDAEQLVHRLRSSGFTVLCTDNFGEPVEARVVDYLYASCTGALKANARNLAPLATGHVAGDGESSEIRDTAMPMPGAAGASVVH